MTKKLYGKTEEEKLASESLECRNIVKTILDYGVSQRQILHAMKRISSLVNEFLDGKSTKDTKIII